MLGRLVVKMPFVTVVTLGAGDLISSVVKPEALEDKSTLLNIRAVDENEFYDDYSDIKSSKLTASALQGTNKKSVSFLELSFLEKQGEAVPGESGYSSPTGSSGSDNGSTSSSSSSSSSGSSISGSSVICIPNARHNDSVASETLNNAVEILRPVNTEPIISSGNLQSFSNNVGSTTSINKIGGTQTKANLWKSWIRNKLNLSKNGKYSLEGASANLGHFSVKTV